LSGGDQPDIDSFFPVFPERPKPFGLQEAQKRGLNGRSHFTDFVEEQGSAIGFLDQPFPVLQCPGKGTFLVSEQFGEKQVLFETGAIDCDVGLPTTRAILVEEKRRGFLSGSGVAEDQGAPIGPAG